MKDLHFPWQIERVIFSGCGCISSVQVNYCLCAFTQRKKKNYQVAAFYFSRSRTTFQERNTGKEAMGFKTKWYPNGIHTSMSHRGLKRKVLKCLAQLQEANLICSLYLDIDLGNPEQMKEIILILSKSLLKFRS